MDAPIKTRVERGDELELTVDSLAFGGAGVARHDGYVVFVRDAMPGDRVRAVVTKRKKAYAEARTVALLEPGPSASTPVAGAPGRAVAGAALRAPARDQGRAGASDALQRIGRLDGYELEPIVPAVEQWRYRNKLEYSFGTADDGDLVCGFHAPGSLGADRARSRTACWPPSAGNEARRAALRWCRERGLGAYDRRAQIGLLRNLVVREGRRTGELQVRLVTSDGRGRHRRLRRGGRRRQRRCGRARSTSARRPPAAETEVLHGDRGHRGGARRAALPHLADAFFQTNTEMAERLYGVAAEYAGLQGFERVYDLFCGIGTIGLSLAPRAGELWGLEIVEEAIADAIANARRNEIDNARFFAGDVRLALRELVEKAGAPDVLVVDPPRAGLSAKVVRRDHRGRAEAHRLRLLQPDDARAERRAARRGRLRAAPRAAGRHVPADAAHRVRGAARARLIAQFAGSWSSGRCKTSNIAVQCRHARTDTFNSWLPPSAAALSVLPATAGATASRSSAGGR